MTPSELEKKLQELQLVKDYTNMYTLLKQLAYIQNNRLSPERIHDSATKVIVKLLENDGFKVDSFWAILWHKTRNRNGRSENKWRNMIRLDDIEEEEYVSDEG